MRRETRKAPAAAEKAKRIGPTRVWRDEARSPVLRGGAGGIVGNPMWELVRNIQNARGTCAKRTDRPAAMPKKIAEKHRKKGKAAPQKLAPRIIPVSNALPLSQCGPPLLAVGQQLWLALWVAVSGEAGTPKIFAFQGQDKAGASSRDCRFVPRFGVQNHPLSLCIHASC